MSTRLAYFGFEVKDLAAWRSFGTEVLGLMLEERDGALVFRMDEQAQRIVCTQGPSDDLSVLGWEVDSDGELEGLVSKLRAAGVDVTHGSSEEAKERRVARLVKFRDPGGLPSEIAVGAEKAATPFHSSVVKSGFVTGSGGLGHCVVNAKSQAESHAFYTDVMGFRLSDHIVCDIQGYKVNIAFFHANDRHHSIAFGDAQRKRIHHFMLEVGSMDDVGLAYDRAIRAGARIFNTLGKHPNDRMFSFYARTPSGFQFELGWGGQHVNDATWKPTTYDRISEWGHHAPEMLAPKAAPEARK